ncbi:cell division protein FtsQ [Pigmentiphaga sp. GD03639]|uniref:Cell division protein FtsQ n=1 Tax=Pigmentiphaga daeguensis TaxID=414049 RepID=A0ABP3M1D6_9BURK|nr:cell division protein FtsQ [Pigmentiphaga sp. GD03639]MDH2236045.1 cell division protein FtsQ [Pigmentiphaga sp. GD03639]
MDKTSSRPGPRYALAGCVMAIVLAAGLLSNGYGLLVEQLPLTRHAPDWPGFLDGRVTAEIADTLAKTPLPAGSASLERGASWLAVGDLGPRVRQGCPDWLFLADELEPHAGGDDALRTRAREVADLRTRLAARGIELLVATVPDKSRIAASERCGVYRPAALEGRLREWNGILQASGVRTVDLEPVLRGLPVPGFLRTDTHWNEAGAEAAAGAIAAAARALPSAAEALKPHQAFAITRGQPQPLAGDLIRLAGIDWLPAPLLPALDQEPRTTFTPVADTAAPATEDDLFGDADLPRVALIGTSYSRNSNFVPFLEAGLQTRVVNVARDGGEFAGAAQAYFKSEEFRDTPPRLIVWEIPERSLQRPLDGETDIWEAAAAR